MTSLAALFGLFFSAFLSATILPGSSEVVMIGLLTAGYGAAGLVAVATVGNVAGAVVNWFIGRGIEHYRNREWFPVSEDKLNRAKGWYHRWGRWSLLLSWVPLAGDALTVAAGVMREPLPSFIALVAIAKGARYVVVALTAAAII